MNDKQKILGVEIDSCTMDEALDRASSWLKENAAHMIVTPNPEIVLEAYKNPEYADTLNRASLSLPDGRGLLFFGKFAERIPGVDFAEALLAVAQEKGERVVCVLRADGRSSESQLRETLQKRFPTVHVDVVGIQKEEWKNADVIEKIQGSEPSIILVGLGFPEQEFWLDVHLKNISSARIGMAVGGAFDFWTGVASRAPKWIQRMGLEWLYRLGREPHRIIRIWRAVVLFPFIVIKKQKF